MADATHSLPSLAQLSTGARPPSRVRRKQTAARGHKGAPATPPLALAPLPPSPITAEMVNYRAAEARYAWMGRGFARTSFDFDKYASTVQICEAVVYEVKYPADYYSYTTWYGLLHPTSCAETDATAARAIQRLRIGEARVAAMQRMVTLEAVVRMAALALRTLPVAESGRPFPRGYYQHVDFRTPPGGPPVETYVFGDYHGSLHAFALQHVQNRRRWYHETDGGGHSGNTLKPHVRLVFLGDYVDRSFYSLEVLYLVLKLRVNNPRNVFLLSGNHEDPAPGNVFARQKQFWCKHGWTWEVEHSKGDPRTAVDASMTELYRTFRHLPKAILAETDCGRVQFSHGVMEEALTPLEEDLARVPNEAHATRVSEWLDEGVDPSSNKFLSMVHGRAIVWTDVSVLDEEHHALKHSYVDRHQRTTFGLPPVRRYLERFGIQTILRGHQHHQSLSLLTDWRAPHSRSWCPPGQPGRWADAWTAKPNLGARYAMATWLPPEHLSTDRTLYQLRLYDATHGPPPVITTASCPWSIPNAQRLSEFAPILVIRGAPAAPDRD